MKKPVLLILSTLIFCSCQKESINEKPNSSIDILDESALVLLDAGAKQEILAEGFDWTEGPLWVEDLNALLFTDIPKNAIYKVTNNGELSLYLTPSGYTGENARGGEVGANGLILNSEGFLVLCQHGDRRMAQMESSVDNPKSAFLTLADSYQGKRLNSPNDAVYDRLGNLYFTDPPYGLEFNVNDPSKELDFQGIYCLKTDGELVLLDTISRPNGITFNPDQSKLLVANSDPKQAVWYQYDIVSPGVVENKQLFFDATDWVGKDGFKGLPDGMKMHGSGNLFATGPGGVWVFSPEGKVLARILTGEATSNCALSPDEKTLYMTADNYLLKLELK